MKIMFFDDDFDDAIRDLDVFSSKLVKIIEDELDELLMNMETEKSDDEVDRNRQEWRTEDRKDKLFDLSKSSDFFKPLKPILKRKKAFEVPEKALEMMTDGLTDVFDNEDTLEIYAELPRLEMEEMKVRVGKRSVEVKAKNFRKVIELPTEEIVGQAATSEYKNGVLKIVIPKKLRLRLKDAKRTRTV